MTTTDEHVGSVAGFAVRSDVPLLYLRGGGSDRMQVVLGPREPPPAPNEPPTREWVPQPDNPFRAKLWRDGHSARIWIHGLGWYAVDTAAGRIELPPDADPVPREERLWGIPTSLCVVARGDQTLHAASVDVGGRAIVFGAPGRHGKTTLAAALHAAGHRLLSEDTTCCRPGAEPVSFPGPAMLRLRRDSFERLGTTDTTVVGKDRDRVHLALDPARRGDGAPLPIAAIVLLRHGERLALERIEPEHAIPELWALAFKLPTDEDRARCFGAVTTLAASLPVWNLVRPLTYESLDAVVETLVGLALG